LWVGVTVIVVLAVLAGVAFLAKPGFLGFKKTLDHTSVEQHIEKSTGYTHVLCNNGKNPTVKKGTTFICTADGGKTDHRDNHQLRRLIQHPAVPVTA
jgi:hypothetical protein